MVSGVILGVLFVLVVYNLMTVYLNYKRAKNLTEFHDALQLYDQDLKRAEASLAMREERLARESQQLVNTARELHDLIESHDQFKVLRPSGKDLN